MSKGGKWCPKFQQLYSGWRAQLLVSRLVSNSFKFWHTLLRDMLRQTCCSNSFPRSVVVTNVYPRKMMRQLVWICAAQSKDKMTSIFGSCAPLLQTVRTTTKKWTNIRLVCANFSGFPSTCVLRGHKRGLVPASRTHNMFPTVCRPWKA